MSDYLTRIVARNLGLAEVVQPRLWSLFEPQPADGGQVFEEHFGRGERDEIAEAEPYAHTPISPSSPLIADRSADSRLPEEEVRTETARRKAADLQTSTQNKSRPDRREAEEHPIPEMTENIPAAVSSPESEMTSSGQNRSNYSAAAVNSGPQRTGRRKAADAKPLSSEAMLGRPLADHSKTETVPATASGETQRFESPSPSPMAPKRIPPDQRQTASSTMTISTETVRRKADETPPFTSETISGRPSPDPNKTETVPATASCERERIGSHFSSQKILKQAPPDRRQTPPAMKAKAETVRRKAVDNQPLVPGSIPDLPRQESGDAKGQPGPERAKTAFVAAKSKIAPHDLRPPGTAVGFDAARRVHQKVADLQPYVSEPIQRRPWSDLDRTRRGPSPDNATYFELTTEGNPSSREMQMPSGPGRD